MKYELLGKDLPVVILTLEKGEKITRPLIGVEMTNFCIF